MWWYMCIIPALRTYNLGYMVKPFLKKKEMNKNFKKCKNLAQLKITKVTMISLKKILLKMIIL